MTLVIVTGLKAEAKIARRFSRHVMCCGGDAAALQAALARFHYSHAPQIVIASDSEAVHSSPTSYGSPRPSRLRDPEKSSITTILSFGIAGGLDPKLQPGDLILATSIMTEYKNYSCDKSLIARLATLLQPLNPLHASLYSAAKPAVTRDEKEGLYCRTGAAAIDMESGIAAAFAAERGLKFAAIRVIADPAGMSLPPAAQIPLQTTGVPNYAKIILSLTAKPQQIPALARLAGNSSVALDTLVGVADCLRNAAGSGVDFV